MYVIAIVFLIHLAGLLALRLYASGRCYFGGANLVWAALIPVFGPLSGFIVIRAGLKRKDYSELVRIVNGVYNEIYDYRRVDADDIVSVEEALLINDNKERRRTMLELLRMDARPYIDVLRLAVNNDDSEVAHYASTMLMQLQTDYQRSAQKLQAAADRPEASESDFRAYISTLRDYIGTGLLDAGLEHRQRSVLRSAIEKAQSGFGCRDLNGIYVENLIQLGELSTAEIYVDGLLKNSGFELRCEDICMLRIRLYILAKDRNGLLGFIGRIHGSAAASSPQLRETIEFWSGGTDGDIPVVSAEVQI